MSQAFMKEGDDQWLGDIPGTLAALILFLSRENNGVNVYEKENYVNEKGHRVHVMSNGASYSKDSEGHWQTL
jgi:hypothetical protein